MTKQPLPHFNLQRCQGSGHCVRVCPTQCLDLWNDRPGLLLASACVSCGLCELVCPVGAVTVPRAVPPTRLKEKLSDDWQENAPS